MTVRSVGITMKPLSNGYRRFRERHIRLGLCVRCSRKPEPGILWCRVCLERSRKWRMEHHPLYCLECRKLIRPEERTGRRIHKKCVQKRIARMHPPTHRKAALAYRRRHRKQGLCIQCPRKVFKGSLCRKHYRMAQERYYERAAG